MDEIQKYRDELFTLIYDRELDRKAKLASYQTFYAGIIIALTSILIFFLNYLLQCKAGLHFYIFCFLVVVYYLSLLLVIYFFVKSVFKYEYGYLPDPRILDTHLNSLIEYQYTLKAPNPEEVALNIFRLYITEKHLDASQINTINNDQKNYHRHRCNFFIVVSLIILALSSAFYGVEKICNSNTQFREYIMPDKKADERPKLTDTPPPPPPPPTKMIVEGETSRDSVKGTTKTKK